MFFAAKQAAERKARERERRERERGRKEGIREEREQISKMLEHQGISLSPELARRLTSDPE